MITNQLYFKKKKWDASLCSLSNQTVYVGAGLTVSSSKSGWGWVATGPHFWFWGHLFFFSFFFFLTDLRLLPQSHCRRHRTLGVAGLGEAGRPGSGGPRAVPPRFRPVSVQQWQRLLLDLPVLVTRVLTALSQVTCFVVWMRLEPGDAEPSGSWGLDGLSPSGWRQPCVAMTTNSALSLLSQKKCILETDEES